MVRLEQLKDQLQNNIDDMHNEQQNPEIQPPAHKNTNQVEQKVGYQTHVTEFSILTKMKLSIEYVI